MLIALDGHEQTCTCRGEGSDETLIGSTVSSKPRMAMDLASRLAGFKTPPADVAESKARISGEHDYAMLLQQAGSLLEGSAVIFRVTGNYNQIVVSAFRRGKNTSTGALTARSVVCVSSESRLNNVRISAMPWEEESTAVS